VDDRIDGIRQDLERIRPGSDTSAVAVTGRVLHLARHVTAQREAELRAFNLTVADYDVLATLRRRAGDTGLNPRDVQRAVMVTSGGTTKRLDRLQQAGLVERHPDPTDRRGVLIRLTHHGRSTIDKTLDAMLDVERRALERAIPDQADRTRLEDLLRQLLVAFEHSEQADAAP
jgi:DNA-binding MarR family transcriptional regulator